MSFRKILLIIVVVDLVLATLAYFIVFYNTPGTYEVASSPLPTTSTALPSSSIALADGSDAASSSQSSTIPTSTSTIVGIGTPAGNLAESLYATDYAVPYPLTWAEGDASISIMGASLQGTQLTFELAVAMGDTTQCVPLNIRELVDEKGTLAAPVTPQFTFPETGDCEGAPGATYTDQQVIFSINPAAMPIFFTTGGASNIFFEAATTTDGGLDVSIPSATGQ
jgi:hypothetical protein